MFIELTLKSEQDEYEREVRRGRSRGRRRGRSRGRRSGREGGEIMYGLTHSGH